MSSIPIIMKVGVAYRAAPSFNATYVRTLMSSNINLKIANHPGKKLNGSQSTEAVPRNIQEINSSVKAKFSPHRTRDASSARIDVKMNQPSGTFGHDFMGSQGSKASQKINTKSKPSDSHVEVYDASNSVSLSSVMQSNVPKPFETKGTEAPAHLGMPGGQWSQGDKYVSGDLHDHHDRNIPKKYPGMGQSTSMYMKFPKKYTGMGLSSLLFLNTPRNPLASLIATPPIFATNTFSSRGLCSTVLENCCGFGNCAAPYPLFISNNAVSAWVEKHPWRLGGYLRESERRPLRHIQMSLLHTSSVILSEIPHEEQAKMSQRQRLKRAVKEYGATVVVFHVAISLASLGLFYLLVSSGIDMSGLIEKLGINLATLKEDKTLPPLEEELLQSLPSLAPSSDENLPSSVPPSDNVPPESEKNGRKRTQAVVAGVSTFVLAYAIHKVFAPVRIFITLTSTPFIVRHLRKIGFLKPPKST